MLKAILFLLIILTTSAVAESTICEDFVPLEKVKNICGKEFLKDETKTSKGKCTIIYIDREMGEKYVEGIGSSPLLLMQSIHQIDISGNNTAPVVFKKTLDLAMNLGVFKKNISGLGESAFYHGKKWRHPYLQTPKAYVLAFSPDFFLLIHSAPLVRTTALFGSSQRNISLTQ